MRRAVDTQPRNLKQIGGLEAQPDPQKKASLCGERDAPDRRICGDYCQLPLKGKHAPENPEACTRKTSGES